ncbi:hypothetical protein [Deinococcus navajonensis]|uniref:Lipopolysaccharide assembly protein A domain-containing protein n=1 Tax=Deinococcus navajonensis TaxID=309884 RepID=A0ABV8XQ56_9DEIO
MRLVSFVQVILLFGLAAYVLLVSLENPALVRLPLPGGQGELTLGLGAAVGSFLLLGGLYTAFLLLPVWWRERRRRLQERRRRQDLEGRLAATLQARLGTAGSAPVTTRATEGSL